MSVSSIDQNMAVFLTKSLMGVFVGGVTLWYLVTPYLVQPHYKFNKDFENFVESSSQQHEAFSIENWTKWKLILGDGDDKHIVDSFQSLSVDTLDIKGGNISAVFEWRSEYQNYIVSTETGLKVVDACPWYSKYGLYNHYYVQHLESGSVRFMPRFMFGVPYETIKSMYTVADNIPITGLIAENPSTDRMMLQCVMNMVTMTVIFLLYINNPPKYLNKKTE